MTSLVHRLLPSFPSLAVHIANNGKQDEAWDTRVVGAMLIYIYARACLLLTAMRIYIYARITNKRLPRLVAKPNKTVG